MALCGKSNSAACSEAGMHNRRCQRIKLSSLEQECYHGEESLRRRLIESGLDRECAKAVKRREKQMNNQMWNKRWCLESLSTLSLLNV